MSIVTELRTAQQQARDAAYATYRTLIGKAAANADGTLDAGERDEFLAVVQTLGFSSERVEVDLEIVREHLADAARMEELEQRAGRLAEFQGQLNAYNAETQNIVAQRNERAQEILDKIAPAEAAARSLDQVRDRQQQRRAAHHELLGIESPDELARRVHIYVSVDRRETPPATAELIEIEAVMIDPTKLDLSRRQIVPLPGQTKREIAALTQRVEEIQQTYRAWRAYAESQRAVGSAPTSRPPWKPFAIYLSPDPDAAAVRHRNVCFSLDEALATFDGEEIVPAVLSLPKQNDEEFVRLRDAFHKGTARRFSSARLPA